jgi:glycosyltransferase involved in cell wall biosynthesis
VGSAPYADAYAARVHGLADGNPRVSFLGAIWDQELLDQLYAGCASYLHGHSVGGTNPSLLRAMGAAAPVTAFDVVFNREVTGGLARIFADASDVAAAIEGDEADGPLARARGRELQQHALATYRWDDVADAYERLCHELAARR